MFFQRLAVAVHAGAPRRGIFLPGDHADAVITPLDQVIDHIERGPGIVNKNHIHRRRRFWLDLEMHNRDIQVGQVIRGQVKENRDQPVDLIAPD